MLVLWAGMITPGFRRSCSPEGTFSPKVGLAPAPESGAEVLTNHGRAFHSKLSGKDQDADENEGASGGAFDPDQRKISAECGSYNNAKR